MTDTIHIEGTQQAIAEDLQIGDVLSDGAKVLGPAKPADVRALAPVDPRDVRKYNPTRDVAYAIAYIDGGTGVRVFARSQWVSVRAGCTDCANPATGDCALHTPGHNG